MFRVPGVLILSIAASACGRSPQLADGPIELTDRPTQVRFLHPMPADGSKWELCFEFSLPRDSHRAGAIHAVLLSATGERASLSNPTLDRRGEAVVCQIGPLELASPGSRPEAYEGVELKSDAPVRLRGLRGGSRS